MKPLKYLSYGVLGIAGVCATLLLAVVAVNWSDEELNPEVKPYTAIRLPQGRPEDNAYFDLLGLSVAADKDPNSEGQALAKIWQDQFRQNKSTVPLGTRSYTEIAEVLNPKVLQDKKFCPPVEGDCIAYYSQQQNVEKTALADDRLLLQRLQVLRTKKKFVEIANPDLTLPTPPYRWLSRYHANELAAAAELVKTGNLEQAIKRLKVEQDFARSVFSSSRLLITRMVVLRHLLESIRFGDHLVNALSAEQLLNHQLALSELYADLSEAQLDWTETLRSELGFQINILESVNFDLWHSSMPFVESYTNKLGPIVFQKNETINRTYSYHLELLNASQHSAEQFLKWRDKKIERNSMWMPFKIRNPMGNVLLDIAEAPFAEYVLRLHDAQGYLRLARTKLALKVKQVEPKDVQSAVAELPQARSIYDHKPFVYDGKTNELIFNGKATHSFLSEPKNVFKVKL